MKILKRMLYSILIIIAAVVLFGWYYMSTPVFGKLPEGARLEKILKSPNYKDGEFQNLSPTPQMAEGHSMWKVMINFLFNKPDNVSSKQPIPVVQTDLKQLPLDKNVIVWLGHSSYFMILDHKTYLVDPVFSGNASPVPGSNKSFKATYNYTINDMPNIDVLLISHDHFDHLDYPTIKALKSNIKQVVCGLGVGAHFEHWGYDAKIIHELDWYDAVTLYNDVLITATPARHFSGRTFKRNTSLFCSYVLQSSNHKLFIGGDSGYDTHFKKIGDTYGPFDLAILENGQYNEAWRYIHTLPTEMPTIIKEINAKKILPVHAGKFALAMHDWKEPFRAIKKYQSEETPILFPQIGVILNIDDSTQVFEDWWESID